MNEGTTVCIDSFEVKCVNRRRGFSCFFSAVGLLILILDGKTALCGVTEGIALCVRSVIPALFPFFVLSSALLRGAVPFPRMERALCALTGFPQGAGSLILPCLLGGYPVGSRSVYQAYTEGIVKKTEAERMLAFCNNAGPAFVFGVLGQMFHKLWMPWALWGIHLAGARIAAYCIPVIGTPMISEASPMESKGNLMPEAILTMGTVCGWIILFRVFIAFLDRWFLWILPQTVRVACVGLLELSNGCCELPQIAAVNIRFILCSGMLAAGGLCVTAQTISVTPGLSLRYYYFGKLIQFFVSIGFSCCLVGHTVVPLCFLLLLPLYRISKKRGRNPTLSGV